MLTSSELTRASINLTIHSPLEKHAIAPEDYDVVDLVDRFPWEGSVMIIIAVRLLTPYVVSILLT